MKLLNTMALIGSIALTLVVTAGCGDKTTAPVGKFTDAQACDVATGSIGTFATAMLPWVYKTEPTTTPTTKADYSAMFHGEFQQKLTTTSNDLAKGATEFTAAFKAKDEATMLALQATAQTKADEMIASCEKAGWTKSDAVTQLRETLNKTPANALQSAPTPAPAPTSSAAPKAVQLSPAGATVKVGDSVTFNYPRPRSGYSTPITFTITAIEKAPAGAVPTEGKNDAVKQFFYIRATAKQTRDESTNSEAVPIYDVTPRFRVTMSDGAKNGQMSGSRDFKPCHNDARGTESGEFCTVWGTVSEKGTIASVELTTVDPSADKKGPAMFTWKND